jgi:hypothetical protein
MPEQHVAEINSNLFVDYEICVIEKKEDTSLHLKLSKGNFWYHKAS